MSANYEPGVPYVATVNGEPGRRVVMDPNDDWFTCDDGDLVWGGGSSLTEDVELTDARPLVVLDLSPHEVMRALEALRGSRGMVAMQVADKLENATRPPKPPEPTGLGAVVEDDKGVRWVRIGELGGAGQDGWKCAGTTRDSRNDWRTWSEFNAVRVLSEGVQS